jgi:pyruvate/2-oxoglutarate dehydrogenase complex dihydrolipoamide dehydrogenase (E3) component
MTLLHGSRAYGLNPCTYVHHVFFFCVNITQAYGTIRIFTEEPMAQDNDATTDTTVNTQANRDDGCTRRVYSCQALLIAAGRKPNVQNIGLEAAGEHSS